MTFRMKERLNSRKTLEKLFGGGCSRSMAAFPVRMVYMFTEPEPGEPPAKLLVSVPKRCFKRAVKRNRAKRLVREAYRLNKDILYNALAEHEGTAVAMAVIWIDDKLHDYAEVERRVKNLLQRLSEKIGKQ